MSVLLAASKNMLHICTRKKSPEPAQGLLWHAHSLAAAALVSAMLLNFNLIFFSLKQHACDKQR